MAPGRCGMGRRDRGDQYCPSDQRVERPRSCPAQSYEFVYDLLHPGRDPGGPMGSPISHRGPHLWPLVPMVRRDLGPGDNMGHARVAELVYAEGLNPSALTRACGFESRPGHRCDQRLCDSWRGRA